MMTQVSSAAPGKRIVFGISGGIAAYKAAELARLWVKKAITVDVVMTAAACRFITPLTMHALSGRPVWQDLWHAPDSSMNHIALSRGADAIVVAPASANFLARLAQGRADDLLSALCLARECPLLVAPAMNTQMWRNPATQRNVSLLRSDGVFFLGPDSGELACGETGEGRMLTPENIAAAVEQIIWSPDHEKSATLKGRNVLITAGPTFEAIDPVRGLTNRSSGKMGFALAEAAALAGANVTLIAGPVHQPTPLNVMRVNVISASDMADAVFARAKGADIFIGVAAVADYTPTHVAGHKLKKNEINHLDLALTATVDILDELGRRAPHAFRVGFAAETQNIRQFGEEKRRRKQLPMLIVNQAQEAFGADDNEVAILDDHGFHALPRMAKTTLAKRLIQEIAQRFEQKD